MTIDATMRTIAEIRIAHADAILVILVVRVNARDLPHFYHTRAFRRINVAFPELGP